MAFDPNSIGQDYGYNKIDPVPEDADIRICITQHDGDGNLISRYYGPTQDELYEMHVNGKCDAFCGYCYDEAMKYLCQGCGYPLDKIGSCPNGMCEDY